MLCPLCSYVGGCDTHLLLDRELIGATAAGIGQSSDNCEPDEMRDDLVTIEIHRGVGLTARRTSRKPEVLHCRLFPIAYGKSRRESDREERWATHHQRWTVKTR
jgi:hypothetical protein